MTAGDDGTNFSIRLIRRCRSLEYFRVRDSGPRVYYGFECYLPGDV